MSYKLYLSIAAYASAVIAATSVPDLTMSLWLASEGKPLATSYAPVWFFGESTGNIPCIPTWAFGNDTTMRDDYKSPQTTAGGLCNFPNVGCNCRHPGVPLGSATQAFPVYYTYDKCNDTEVRVAYNLFYQKDGTNGGGHGYDWERVIVIHSKGSGGTWAPSQALLSQHSGYQALNWGDIQNTLTTEEASAPDLRTPNGVKNNDHPKIYISWSKHANYDFRLTNYNDIASQENLNAFRSQDWWYSVDSQYYIWADPSTDAGKALGSANWGDATSNPALIQTKICSIQGAQIG